MGRPPTNLRGKTYARLSAVKYVGSDKTGSAIWQCICSCGTKRIIHVKARNLVTGRTRSCGCLRSEWAAKHANTTLRERNITHGLSHTDLYKLYQSMRQRCENPLSTGWESHGKRRIAVAFANFEEFTAAVPERPSPKHTLHRIDNDGPYAAGNLVWVLPKVQAHPENRRKRRNPVLIALEREAEQMRLERETAEAQFVAA